MNNYKDGTCPNCGFDYKKLKPQLKMVHCPNCGQSCADISDLNSIRVLCDLIPKKKNKYKL